MTAKRSVVPAAILAVALSFIISACGTSSSPGADSGTTTPRPSASAKPPVTDQADADAQEAAVEVAVAAMTAFADHDRGYDEWWASLSPYLDPEATQAYAYTDPRLVPPTHVTGPGQVSSASSSTEVSVLVPTDAGQYRVDLFRQADGAGPGPWLVNAMTPSER